VTRWPAAKDAAENELHAAGVSDAALERVATADDGDNSNSYLNAPIGGTIVRRSVTLGETVSAGDAGSQTLFTIADDSVVWADIGVYKQDLSRIKKQAAVVIRSEDGTILAESNVAFILPSVQTVENKASVFVPIEGGFEPRFVSLGTESGGYVEIRSGLSAGDSFVSGGAFTLKAQLESPA